jgi:hypothetical protein
MNIEEAEDAWAKERVEALVRVARMTADEIEDIAPATTRVIEAFANLLERASKDEKLT